MPTTVATAWLPTDFCLGPIAARTNLRVLATVVYDRVCRTNFDAPGFCLVDVGATVSSETLRRLMVALVDEMRQIHEQKAGRDLVAISAARFDQQVTTKLHRDGGPDECFLVLGYERSGVEATLAIADYSRCAYELGLTPAEFLDQHNPMFGAGEELLAPYTTPVACFTSASNEILLINNSAAPLSEESWQGVLHTATILNPDDSRRRVVNSMMVASPAAGATEVLSTEQLKDFVQTQLVRRHGYDKPHLQDDR
jgi:hypothetical protein